MRAQPKYITCIVFLLACACSSGEHVTPTDRLDCNSCHATLYEAATFHEDMGYSRSCWQCHGVTDWNDTEPTHDRFNIAQGPHAGYDCTDCHLSRDDRKQTTCTTCHWHTQSRTDLRHLGNGGYSYEPASCLRCHERGN